MGRTEALGLLARTLAIAAQAAKQRWPEPQDEPPTNVGGEGLVLIANVVKERVDGADDTNVVVVPATDPQSMTATNSIEVWITAPYGAKEIFELCASSVAAYADVVVGVEFPTPEAVQLKFRTNYN